MVGATVTLRDVDRGAVYRPQTNQEGVYNLPRVPTAPATRKCNARPLRRCALQDRAPAEWQKKNLQMILHGKVIAGVPLIAEGAQHALLEEGGLARVALFPTRQAARQFLPDIHELRIVVLILPLGRIGHQVV